MTTSPFIDPQTTAYPKRCGLITIIMMVAVLMVFAVTTTPSFAADRIATVEYSKGAVSVVGDSGALRLLGRGSDIFVGDLIETASQSFAIVKFEDGTRMTLRPNTEFRIDGFAPAKTRGQALFKLIKGGFRVLTGFISKTSDGVFKVDTPVATIGVRGTEFDARLCIDEKCAENQSAQSVDAVAVVTEQSGDVTVINNQTNDGRDGRRLLSGSSVLAGDSLQTASGAWALLTFSDGTQVTLQPDSILDVREFNLDPGNAALSTYVVRLVKGGLRTATGRIAKINPSRYRTETLTSNITTEAGAFDLSADAEVNVRVHDGCVDFLSAGGTVPVCSGQSATQREPDGLAALTNDIPAPLRNPMGPTPVALTQSDGKTAVALAPGAESVSGEPRLFVTVTEGLVDLKNRDASESLALGPSQNAVVSPDGEIRLIEDLPDSMQNDVLPKPGAFNEQALGLLDLMQVGLARNRASQTAKESGNQTGTVTANADSDGGSTETDDNASTQTSGDNSDNSDDSDGDTGVIPMECAVQ